MEKVQEMKILAAMMEDCKNMDEIRVNMVILLNKMNGKNLLNYYQHQLDVRVTF